MTREAGVLDGAGRVLAVAAFGALCAAPAAAQNLRPVVQFDSLAVAQAVSDDGGVVLARWAGDPGGLNPAGDVLLWRWNPPSTTPVPIGTASRVSLADDGSVFAAMSNIDPFGTNADGGAEVFLFSTADGSVQSQITDLPLTGLFPFALSGDGARLAYAGPFDPAGFNPALDEQVFVKVLGSLTRQTTAYGGGSIEEVSISDDGNRVAFIRRVSGDNTVHQALWTGGDLTQLSAAGQDSARFVSISGDGTTVAYRDGGVRVVDLAGVELYHAPAGDFPTLTDDGTVYYEEQSSANDRKIMARDNVAFDPASPVHAYRPLVSGDGTRMVFRTEYGPIPGVTNADGSAELTWAETDGSGAVGLTDTGPSGSVSFPDISADGTRVAFSSFGSAGAYLVEPDGAGLLRLTSGDLPTAVGFGPDEETVLVADTKNLTDDPLCGPSDPALWSVGVDGTGLAPFRPCGENHITIAGYDDGVVTERLDLTTTDGVYAYDGSGAEIVAVTEPAFTIASIREPRVATDGSWVVFKYDTLTDPAGTQIYRAPLPGGVAEAVTDDPDFGPHNGPDVSADGSRIVFDSNWDPLGTNADGNFEIFLVEEPGGAVTQLTDTVDVYNNQPLISGNGEWVWFASTAGFFSGETDFYELYRLRVADGLLERVQGPLTDDTLCRFYDGSFRDEDRPCFTVDASGDRGAFADGQSLPRNSLIGGTLYLVEFDAPNVWEIDPTTPASLGWNQDPRFLTYDVARGELANLAPGAGGTVELGPLVCLEDDTSETTRMGFDDFNPPPGEGFFYLFRGSAGALAPGTWGASSAGAERVAVGGDCP